jgi:hypothetical protein
MGARHACSPPSCQQRWIGAVRTRAPSAHQRVFRCVRETRGWGSALRLGAREAAAEKLRSSLRRIRLQPVRYCIVPRK